MKIAVNTRFLLSNKLEGIGWHTYEILRRLVLAHPQDSFYFFFDRPYDPQFVFAPNVHPLVLFPPARHPILFYWWFEWSVSRALRQINPDVFYSPDGFLSLRSQTPTLLTIHDLAYRHFPEHLPPLMRTYYNRMMPQYVMKAGQIAAVSEYTKEDIIQQFNVSPERISVVYNGVRSVFSPDSTTGSRSIRHQVTGGNPYFLYVGSMHPRKNINRLLEAFRLFKASGQWNHHLILVGRMAWKSTGIRQEVEQHPDRATIHLPGNITDEQMVDYYREAQALIYPSLFEGFGMPVLEALACHTLPVISQSSSLPEVGGEVAIYVDPLDPGSIVQGMQRATQHDPHHPAWTHRVDQHLKKFNWNRSADQIYRDLCKLSGY
ncbi:MAG: glycosyltransferase family 1 protein [Saprospiraceae bacterium]